MMFTRGNKDAWLHKPAHNTLYAALAVGNGSNLCVFDAGKLIKIIPLIGRNSAHSLFGTQAINEDFYRKWADILVKNYPKLLAKCN